MGFFSKRRRKSSIGGTNPLLRWLGPGVTASGLLYALYLFLSGGLNFTALDGFLGSSDSSELQRETISFGAEVERPADGIRIATFNIEQFAESKAMRDTELAGIDILATIAKIITAFDVIAIQELQGTDGIALQRLIALLNESGANFAATMSDPVGDDAPESYAFVWDQTRITLVPGSAYVVQDPGKRMSRAPMVATFQAVVPSDSQRPPFRFTMINVRTQPDRVDAAQQENEINVLADVFQRVRQYEFEQTKEDDFILLGDLNVGDNQLGPLKTIPGVLSLAADIHTNVDRTRTCDHILIDRSVTAEFSGRLGVVDLVADLGLSQQQATAVSDHIPLWAEFDRYEKSPPPRPASVAAETQTRMIQ